MGLQYWTVKICPEKRLNNTATCIYIFEDNYCIFCNAQCHNIWKNKTPYEGWKADIILSKIWIGTRAINKSESKTGEK